MQDEELNPESQATNSEQGVDDFAGQRASFGERLRLLREQRGFSRKDVANITKISEQFILSLEEGKFEFIPGRVFGYGFIRNILSLYQVDSNAFVEEYRQCWDAGEYGKDQEKVHRKNRLSVSWPFRLQPCGFVERGFGNSR